MYQSPLSQATKSGSTAAVEVRISDGDADICTRYCGHFMSPSLGAAEAAEHTSQALLKAGVDANSGSSVLHGIIAAYSSLGESAQKCVSTFVCL